MPFVVNPQVGDYDYRVIVKRGTPYPTRQPIARLTVKASFSGQTDLGIAIFELANAMRNSARRPSNWFSTPAEPRAEVAPDEEERRNYFGSPNRHRHSSARLLPRNKANLDSASNLESMRTNASSLPPKTSRPAK